MLQNLFFSPLLLLMHLLIYLDSDISISSSPHAEVLPFRVSSPPPLLCGDAGSFLQKKKRKVADHVVFQGSGDAAGIQMIIRRQPFFFR